MGFLPSAAGLTNLRATVERSFDKTVTVRRTTLVDDEHGGQIPTTTETTYAGRVSPRQVVPSERLQGTRLAAETVYVVRLPWDADVIPADVLVVDGATLQVTDDDDIKSTKLHLIVNAYRVT